MKTFRLVARVAAEVRADSREEAERDVRDALSLAGTPWLDLELLEIETDSTPLGSKVQH